LDVKVPPGTSSGAKLRLRGKGLAGGDQFLVFKIVVPSGVPDARLSLADGAVRREEPADARVRNVPWAVRCLESSRHAPRAVSQHLQPRMAVAQREW